MLSLSALGVHGAIDATHVPLIRVRLEEFETSELLLREPFPPVRIRDVLQVRVHRESSVSPAHSKPLYCVSRCSTRAVRTGGEERRGAGGEPLHWRRGMSGRMHVPSHLRELPIHSLWATCGQKMRAHWCAGNSLSINQATASWSVRADQAQRNPGAWMPALGQPDLTSADIMRSATTSRRHHSRIA